MFRGEPLALTTILTGFTFFIITIFLGMFMPGSLFQANTIGIMSAHYISAYFGWIGLVILGAQLQFFRAIAGIRRFTPDYLRYIYYGTAVSGVIFLIVGTLLTMKILIFLGLFIYSITVGIHSYWLFKEVKNKLFKFPLNYFIGGHIFLLIAMVMSWIQTIQYTFLLPVNFATIHFLAIGWISLNLQGAMIRILPMFVGKTIDRTMRPQIEWHFYLSFGSSMGLAISLPWLSKGFIWVFASLWMLSWLWVVVLLARSILNDKLKFDKSYTLWYFIPGFLSIALGAMIGFHTATAGHLVPRATHIHLNLLSGLSLIMIGAINRITSFQMYTLAYTGRKEEGVRLEDFLHETWMKRLAPGFVLSTILIVFYFTNFVNKIIFAIAIIILVIHVIGYSVILILNVTHFKRSYKDAIPYYLKPSEVENNK